MNKNDFKKTQKKLLKTFDYANRGKVYFQISNQEELKSLYNICQDLNIDLIRSEAYFLYKYKWNEAHHQPTYGCFNIIKWDMEYIDDLSNNTTRYCTGWLIDELINLKEDVMIKNVESKKDLLEIANGEIWTDGETAIELFKNNLIITNVPKSIDLKVDMNNFIKCRSLKTVDFYTAFKEYEKGDFKIISQNGTSYVKRNGLDYRVDGNEEVVINGIPFEDMRGEWLV